MYDTWERTRQINYYAERGKQLAYAALVIGGILAIIALALLRHSDSIAYLYVAGLATPICVCALVCGLCPVHAGRVWVAIVKPIEYLPVRPSGDGQRMIYRPAFDLDEAA